jgi:hypothetical protein
MWRSHDVILFLLVPLAVIGLIALFTGGISAATALGVGAAFIAVKVFFVLMLFGMMGRFFWSHRQPWGPADPWRRPRRPKEHVPSRSPEEMFEEWHRLAHAREEVDSWVPDPGKSGDSAQ